MVWLSVGEFDEQLHFVVFYSKIFLMIIWNSSKNDMKNVTFEKALMKQCNAL